MRISVIIPTYKPQAYLWECLDSMVAQTFPKEEFEVILVLNGCTEPYKSDIERYISTKMAGMNVQFIHTEQGGVSNARNIGLDAAKGEYIAFIDDDDYVSPAYLEELYKAASPDTISLCYPYAFNDGLASKQIEYVITNQYKQVAHKGKQPYLRARKFFSGPWMKLIPMSFIQGRRFNPRFRNGEDSLFMFLVSNQFKYVDFTSRNAVYYRRYRTNSAVFIKRKRTDLILNSMRMINYYLRIYFSRPFEYNTVFLFTRLAGAFRIMLQ